MERQAFLLLGRKSCDRRQKIVASQGRLWDKRDKITRYWNSSDKADCVGKTLRSNGGWDDHRKENGWQFIRIASRWTWSGLRGSNSLPPPWQGGALPDELKPRFPWNAWFSIARDSRAVKRKFRQGWRRTEVLFRGYSAKWLPPVLICGKIDSCVKW